MLLVVTRQKDTETKTKQKDGHELVRSLTLICETQKKVFGIKTA
jgi:hypothetical protein